MKINIKSLSSDQKSYFKEDLDFSNETFNPSFCRGVKSCHIEGNISVYQDIIHVDCHIKSKLIAVCAYTLDDVELDLNLHEQFDFTNDKEDDENIYIDTNIIDFDSYVLDILLASIPTRVIKKGAKRPDNGKWYTVMSEEEYYKEKECNDSHFDELYSLLDDED